MKNKKKILLVGHDASRTGAPKLFLDIARIIIKEGHEIVFLLGRTGPFLKEYKALGKVYLWNKDFENMSNVSKVVYKVKKKLNPGYIECMKAIKRWGPELIINNTAVTGEMINELEVLNIPISSIIHELETVIKFYNKNNNSSTVIRNSSLIMTVSDAVKNNLIDKHQVSKDQVSTVYGFVPKIDIESCSVQKGKIRTNLNIPENAFVVGACGTLISRKGVDFFINTAELLKNKSDIYFLWLGGSKESLGYIEAKEEIKKRGIESKILFIGEQENPYPFYSVMDLFYMCSREDPFPLSMLEAAQFNIPIFGFKNAGGVEEFIKKGGGFLANFADVKVISDKILDLSNDKELYFKYVEEMKNNNEEYNEENSISALKKYIEKVTSL